MSLSRRMRRERRRDLAAVALILAFAFLIVSGSAVGNFMAEKVIAPLMALADKSGSRSGGEGTVTVTVTPVVPAVFAVSVGTFPADELVKAEENLKQLNGGAYAQAHDGGTELLFGCFASRAAAENVAAGLTGTFPETTIRTVTAEVPSVRLTGSHEQTQLIADSFTLLSETVAELLSCADALSSGDLTRLQASVKLREKENALTETLDALKELSTTHAAVRALREAVLCMETLLSGLPAGTDGSFIRQLHYTAAAASREYADFLTKM